MEDELSLSFPYKPPFPLQCGQNQRSFDKRITLRPTADFKSYNRTHLRSAKHLGTGPMQNPMASPSVPPSPPIRFVVLNKNTHTKLFYKGRCVFCSSVKLLSTDHHNNHLSLTNKVITSGPSVNHSA